jgi:diaminopimelate decarboxylase
MTAGFSRPQSELVCDDQSLWAIADQVGTPAYVYSGATVRARYHEIDDAFGGYPHRVHYALKANSTLALVTLLRSLGSAADANSIWEIDVACRAGFTAADLVFTGVGKSAAELERAVPLGLRAINVESSGELDRIEAIAARLGLVARVAIRLNPDIDAESHPHISTGLKSNKFGVTPEAARAMLASFDTRPHLRLVAVHAHIGSQITSVGPIRHAARYLAHLAGALSAQGVTLEYLDVGGGLGIAYDEADVLTPREYVAAILDEIRPAGLLVVIEPGRSLIGPAGVLIGTVVDIKPRAEGGEFVVLDAGMTELMRPALYDAFHRIEAVRPRDGAPRLYEIVGPVCESTDVLGRNRMLPPLQVGDRLAIRDVGAYGAAMASNYNRRPLPVEVLVDRVDGGDGAAWWVVRRRQTVDDLLALER